MGVGQEDLDSGSGETGPRKGASLPANAMIGTNGSFIESTAMVATEQDPPSWIGRGCGEGRDGPVGCHDQHMPLKGNGLDGVGGMGAPGVSYALEGG